MLFIYLWFIYTVPKTSKNLSWLCKTDVELFHDCFVKSTLYAQYFADRSNFTQGPNQLKASQLQPYLRWALLWILQKYSTRLQKVSFCWHWIIRWTFPILSFPDAQRVLNYGYNNTCKALEQILGKMKHAASVPIRCHLSPDYLEQDIRYPFRSIWPQVLDKFSSSYHYRRETSHSCSNPNLVCHTFPVSCATYDHFKLHTFCIKMHGFQRSNKCVSHSQSIRHHKVQISRRDYSILSSKNRAGRKICECLVLMQNCLLFVYN